MTFLGAPWWRRYGRFGLTILLTILISIGVYVGSGTLFRITTIEVASSDIALVVDERKIPKNLLFFPADTIARDLLSSHPLLADITFQKKFPHTLVVVPHVRKPVARLHGTDRRVLVDREGMVLGDDDGVATLPLIELPIIGLRIGGIVPDPRAKQAIRFLSATHAFLSVSRITALDERYLQAEADTFRIFFTQDAPHIVRRYLSIWLCYSNDTMRIL